MSTDQTEPIQPTEPTGPTEPIQMIQDTPPTPADTPTTPLPAPLPPAAVVPAPAEPIPPARPALRVGTVVWGLVLAVIGAGVIAVAAGARFDVELASIALLTLAGVALLAGSIATSARRRNR